MPQSVPESNALNRLRELYMSKPLLTTGEVAFLLGVGVPQVRQLIYKGKLKATRIGPLYTIRPEDLSAVNERRVGRPKTR